MLYQFVAFILLCSTTLSAMALPLHEPQMMIPDSVQKEFLLPDELPIDDADDSAAETEFAHSLESSHLEAEEPVTSSYLKIVGRGVQNRRTHDVIALACIGAPQEKNSVEPSCSLVRHVKLKADTQQLVYIGRAYPVTTPSQTPTDKELSHFVKKINREVKLYKRETLSTTNTILGFLGYATVFISVGSVFGAGIAGIVVVGSIILILTETKLFLFPNSGVISKVMTDQKGWNWSVRPKKVSARSYRWFERYLSSQPIPSLR